MLTAEGRRNLLLVSPQLRMDPVLGPTKRPHSILRIVPSNPGEIFEERDFLEGSVILKPLRNSLQHREEDHFYLGGNG